MASAATAFLVNKLRNRVDRPEHRPTPQRTTAPRRISAATAATFEHAGSSKQLSREQAAFIADALEAEIQTYKVFLASLNPGDRLRYEPGLKDLCTLKHQVQRASAITLERCELALVRVSSAATGPADVAAEFEQATRAMIGAAKQYQRLGLLKEARATLLAALHVTLRQMFLAVARKKETDSVDPVALATRLRAIGAIDYPTLEAVRRACAASQKELRPNLHQLEQLTRAACLAACRAYTEAKAAS